MGPSQNTSAWPVAGAAARRGHGTATTTRGSTREPRLSERKGPLQEKPQCPELKLSSRVGNL